MNKLFSTKLRFTHKSGANLYPVMMRDRNTGKQEFRLSKIGNTKADSIFVTDEDEMTKMVTKLNYLVRARTIASTRHGGINGLYRLNGRSIQSFQIYVG